MSFIDKKLSIFRVHSNQSSVKTLRIIVLILRLDCYSKTDYK